jgi:hypothetical protein
MAVDIDGVNSTISTDKLIPQSGTALQIGDASDVITIPASATITNLGTATGFGGGGKVLKHDYSIYSSTTTTTSTFGFDSSIPQKTEGVELTTLAFAPTSASSVLMIDYWVNFARDNSDAGFMAIFVDTTADALNFSASQGVTNMYTMWGKHFVASVSTSSRTYKLHAAASPGGYGTCYINKSKNGSTFGATHHSGLAVTEIGA